MIIKIAWKNIWRNRVRSLVVIIAVALGLWAGVFASAFVKGMMDQKVDSVIRLEMSHVQVHHPKFTEEMLPEYFIPDGIEILQNIKQDTFVEEASGRVISMVMLASPNQSGAVKLSGIDPEDERTVTLLDQRVTEGEYLDGSKRNPVLISRRLAEDYQVKVRSKMVITVQDVNREITAGAFRVCGIFETENGLYDDMNIFVIKEDIQKIIGLQDQIHEIAVLLTEHDLADPVATLYQEKHPHLKVEPWLDLSAGMRFMIEAFDTYLYFIVGIILLALVLSIINTMLMAILERTREIGMLMAIGMNKWRLFKMILMETIFLSMVGGPLGLFLAWITIKIFGNVGINLSGAAYGEMGFGNIIYPYLEFDSYLRVTLMVLVMAILASFYPAWKALRLNPVEAIRKL